MAALSANTARKTRNTRTRLMAKYPIKGGQVIYAGSLVMVDTSGFAYPGGDTASRKFVGVAKRKYDGTGLADGALTVEVYFGHEELFTTASVTAADIGANGTISDSDTISNAATTTNDVLVGEIVEYLGSNQAWIAIRRFV